MIWKEILAIVLPQIFQSTRAKLSCIYGLIGKKSMFGSYLDVNELISSFAFFLLLLVVVVAGWVLEEGATLVVVPRRWGGWRGGGVVHAVQDGGAGQGRRREAAVVAVGGRHRRRRSSVQAVVLAQLELRLQMGILIKRNRDNLVMKRAREKKLVNLSFSWVLFLWSTAGR